jgi:O-methyltransferase
MPGRLLARLLRGRPSAAPTEPVDDLRGFSAADRAIIAEALPFTMTSPQRIGAVVDATRHCIRCDLTGALVECGVWRGGSVLAMLLTLRELDVDDRDVYLYDTFEGMTRPSEQDVSSLDGSALDEFVRAEHKGERPWAEFFGEGVYDESSVRATLEATGYPAERLHLVKGKVEDTIPATAPHGIALLRLDTDWYESTRHELDHLYPQLCEGGVLIVDDYGHWEGARRAVDEYFAEHAPAPLLNRIDYTGRIAIKH